MPVTHTGQTMSGSTVMAKYVCWAKRRTSQSGATAIGTRGGLSARLLKNLLLPSSVSQHVRKKVVRFKVDMLNGGLTPYGVVFSSNYPVRMEFLNYVNPDGERIHEWPDAVTGRT